MTEQLETIDVIEAVTERVAAWQPVADGHEVKLIAEVSADSGSGAAAGRPMVALGAGHLEQILDNLIDNAIDASSEPSAGRRRHRPHLGRRDRDRNAADGGRRRPGDDRRRSGRARSCGTPPAARTAPGSASPSCTAWSPPTAGRSGWPTPPGAG